MYYMMYISCMYVHTFKLCRYVCMHVCITSSSSSFTMTSWQQLVLHYNLTLKLDRSGNKLLLNGPKKGKNLYNPRTWIVGQPMPSQVPHSVFLLKVWIICKCYQQLDEVIHTLWCRWGQEMRNYIKILLVHTKVKNGFIWNRMTNIHFHSVVQYCHWKYIN